MYFIALQMLFGDRGKYLTIIIGITFASLIMTQQPAILLGLLSRTYSFIGDVASPDVWVMDPGVQYVEEHKPLRDTDLARVRSVTGVAWAVPLYKNFMTAKLPDGNTKTIDMTGVDDATLIGGPPIMVQGSLADLRRADAVIVDEEAANKRLRVRNPDGTTRPLAVGDELELNDRRAVVVGLAKASRNFVLQPVMYTTYSRAITFSPQKRRMLTYVLVRAQEGVEPAALATHIADQTGLMAHTHADFKDITLDYWMTNTGIPINFGISVFLGFVVGAAIAGQAFYGFVRDNLRQYASLKAMGLRNGVLVRMVMLQGLVSGLIGYGLGVGLTSFFGLQMRDSVLAFKFHPLLLLFAALGVGLIVCVAAALAIRQVLRVDPAAVFRT